MTIKLSEHRRPFRIGGQAIDVFMDHVINQPEIVILLDEPIELEAKQRMIEWYTGLGVQQVVFVQE